MAIQILKLGRRLIRSAETAKAVCSTADIYTNYFLKFKVEESTVLYCQNNEGQSLSINIKACRKDL